MTVVTHGADETRALGRSLAELLGVGDVVLLAGGLGAGKTTFVKGIAAGLGVTDEVVSPTFTLARTYDDGRLPLVHVDVYRLEREAEVLDLGLEDLADDGVLVVEWGDAVATVLGGDHLDVRLDLRDDADERAITFDPIGASWASRADALQALGPRAFEQS